MVRAAKNKEISALGQKPPRVPARGAAALPPKADTAVVRHRGRLESIGDMAMLGPGLVDSSQAGAPIAGVTHLVLDAQ